MTVSASRDPVVYTTDFRHELDLVQETLLSHGIPSHEEQQGIQGAPDYTPRPSQASPVLWVLAVTPEDARKASEIIASLPVSHSQSSRDLLTSREFRVGRLVLLGVSVLAIAATVLYIVLS